jgi:hypothetical protein
VKLDVELRPAGTLRPGDAIAGSVRMLEGGGSRSLSVALEYVEQSPGYTDVAMQVPGQTLQSGDLQTGATFDFSLPLPHDALPGQDLPHGRLFWRVHAKSDERGLDTHAYAELASDRLVAA